LPSLQPHDLLLQSVSGDEPVHRNNALLANAVGTVHGLQVALRVPVVLNKDHRVGTGQVQAQTADMRGQEQSVDSGVRVELLDQRKASRCLCRAVESQVGGPRQVLLENDGLDQVQSCPLLGKDQNAVVCGSGDLGIGASSAGVCVLLAYTA